ncbi:hypothetical protein GGX14DRAFT_698947 [Mycena pura]|uniref:Rhodopsin domain-containing protein n=1 Tax=Mycena pura TaxID=153505 RepID=A0AAD6V827_9AGAR|nr:hypothetical protein GGX14DRAFT_698947 [Mycena pura]
MLNLNENFFALGTTIYRLVIRSLRGRLWVDDFWALFALMALIVQVVSAFLHIPIPNNLSLTARVAAYYLLATTFYAIIWGSRLSILFSIIRLDPSVQRRKHLSYIAFAFLVIMLFLLAQLLWVCEPEPTWKNAPNPQCKLPLQVVICQLVTDILADSILLIAPLPLFRSLSDKGLRRKLTLIFSTCIVTTIVSLVHAAFILRNSSIKILVSAVVEDCFSLIVANIPVVVTSLVRIDGETDDSETTWSTSVRFNKWLSALTHTTHSTRTGPSISQEERNVTAVNLRSLRGGGERTGRPLDDGTDQSKSTTSKHISSVFWKREGDDLETADELSTVNLPTRKIAFADDIPDADHLPAS